MVTKILRPTGTLTLNTPGPINVVGTTPVGDDDFDTYMDFEPHVAATTVGLEPLVGYELGDPIRLYVQLSVEESEPGFAGTGEFFIATDAGQSNNEIAGFSDGSGSGYAFGIGLEVQGSLIVKNLNLTPFGTTMAELVEALEDGAFLDFNSFSWLEGSIPPVFRVYDVWIQVGEDEEYVPLVEGFENAATGAVLNTTNTDIHHFSHIPAQIFAASAPRHSGARAMSAMSGTFEDFLYGYEDGGTHPIYGKRDVFQWWWFRWDDEDVEVVPHDENWGMWFTTIGTTPGDAEYEIFRVVTAPSNEDPEDPTTEDHVRRFSFESPESDAPVYQKFFTIPRLTWVKFEMQFTKSDGDCRLRVVNDADAVYLDHTWDWPSPVSTDLAFAFHQWHIDNFDFGAPYGLYYTWYDDFNILTEVSVEGNLGRTHSDFLSRR